MVSRDWRRLERRRSGTGEVETVERGAAERYRRGGTFGGESGAMEEVLARRSRHFRVRTLGGCRNWPGGGLEGAAEFGPRGAKWRRRQLRLESSRSGCGGRRVWCEQTAPVAVSHAGTTGNARPEALTSGPARNQAGQGAPDGVQHSFTAHNSRPEPRRKTVLGPRDAPFHRL